MTSNLIGSKEVDIGFDKDKQSINVAYRINPLVVVFCRVSFAKLVFQGKFGGKAAHYFVNCILNISINAINITQYFLALKQRFQICQER